VTSRVEAIPLSKTTTKTNDSDKSVVMYHYSKETVLKGALRPDSYVTPDGTLSSDQAANYLALDPGNVPDGTQLYVHPVRLQEGEYRPAANSLSENVVKPSVGRGGGGIEFQTNVPKQTLQSYPARPSGEDY
jgi:hypothetical protein